MLKIKIDGNRVVGIGVVTAVLFVLLAIVSVVGFAFGLGIRLAWVLI